MEPQDAVLGANTDFYVAFARGDGAAMDALWARRAEVTCIHPGWQALVGRAAVMESWQAILASPPAVRCIGARVFLNGTSAHVICDEGLGDGMLVATNLFVFEDDVGRMVHHQAGPTRTVQDVTPVRGAPVH